MSIDSLTADYFSDYTLDDYNSQAGVESSNTSDQVESSPASPGSSDWGWLSSIVNGIVSAGNTAMAVYGKSNQTPSTDMAYQTMFGQVNGAPSESTSVWDTMKNALLQAAVKAGLATPIGQQVQQEAQQQTINSYIVKIFTSPITYIALAGIGIAIWMIARKR